MNPTLPPYANLDTYFSTPLDAMYWNAVYYPNWRIYRDQPPVSLNFDVISHVFYAFAWQV
jgi:chitinase